MWRSPLLPVPLFAVFHLCARIMAGQEEKREEGEQHSQDNMLHHPDTWLSPCGKPQWQMLRVRVKGKVLGNDMWNRGQAVEPPPPPPPLPPCIADVLHCTIVDREAVWRHTSLRDFGEGGFLTTLTGESSFSAYFREQHVILTMLTNTKGIQYRHV